MKCPDCLGPIEPTDRTCPTCHSLLIVERRPSRPDEEPGWHVRRFGSIAGRAGSILVAAHYGVVFAAVIVLAGVIQGFAQDPSNPADLSGAAPLIVAATTLDLVGVGLLAIALVALGAGSVLMVRRDPAMDAETRVPPIAGALLKGAGLFAFTWLLLTLAWREALPTKESWTAVFPAGGSAIVLPVGPTAVDLLAAFAAAGSVSPPAAFRSMMLLWIVASLCLVAAAALFRSFARALPSKVVASRPIGSSGWLRFAIVNAIVTIGLAAFPLGWLPFAGYEIVFRSLLATQLIVVPILGIPAYLALRARFAALGELALLVPALRAVPAGEDDADEGTSDEEQGARTSKVAIAPARGGIPAGLGRLQLGNPKRKAPEKRT